MGIRILCMISLALSLSFQRSCCSFVVRISLSVKSNPSARTTRVGTGCNRLRQLTIANLDSTMSSADLSLLDGKMYLTIEDGMAVHGKTGVAFVDGSWWLGRDVGARQQHQLGPRIRGAHFFDIDDICSKGPEINPKNLPHMLPPARLFAAAMDAMHINNSHHVILYAQEGCPFLHRSWYTFRSMGHDPSRLHLLNGSVKAWKLAGGPVEEDDTSTASTSIICANELNLTVDPFYRATDAQQVVDMVEMRRVVDGSADVNESNVIIVDARSSDRFYGRVNDPRPGLRLGHMPGARNLFFMNILDPTDPARLKAKQDLLPIINQAGVDVMDTEQKIYVSCGSGVTACTIAAALISAGKDPSKIFLYDGSWMEWESDLTTPVVTVDS